MIEMGSFIVFLTMVVLLLGFMWYKIYAQKRASQDSALVHVLEKLVAEDRELTSDNLLTELKDIVIQRDEVTKDKFHKLIEEARVLDIEGILKVEDFFKDISDILGEELNLNPRELCRKFMEREKEASTVIKKGLGIPHIVIEGKNIAKILLARAKAGVVFPQDEVVHTIFVIVGTADERIFHLKILAAIAQIAQNPDFDKRWMDAKNEEGLRNVVLLAERRRG